MKKYSRLTLFSAALSLMSIVTLATTGVVNAEENTNTSPSSETSTKESEKPIIDSSDEKNEVKSENTISNTDNQAEENREQNTEAALEQLEKEQAQQAGFTEQQFNQIMNIPKLAAATLPPISRATSQQNSVVSMARAQIGKPYAWGASGPGSFDCGGLAKYVYKQAANINLPMGTTNQEKYGAEVGLSSLQPGDLLFYGSRGATYHVGIYIGSNQMIHAPQPGQNVTAVNIKYFYPSFARRVLGTTANTNPKTYPCNTGQAANERFIFRLYNKNAGQHHYTQVTSEAVNVLKAGWNYEGVGWVAPSSGTNVYRMYNPNNGRHHYTPHVFEKNNLIKAGWKYEGVSWYSGGSTPVYRLYNPNAAAKADSHHYTPLASERDSLVKAGWKSEGIAWYAARILK